MRRVLLAGVLVSTVAVAVAAQQQAPEPPPVIFRSEVNYVEVDAIVTDVQGHVVSDLTERDFDVLEDGKAQKITAFSRVELPIERAERPLFAGRPIEPDVRTNRAVEGRIYLIVLDDLHTGFERTPRVKAAARRFIEQAVGLTDIAAVVYTGRNDASQDFTSNPRLLLEAVDRFTGRKLRSATQTELDGANVDPFDPTRIVAGPDIDKGERAYRARSAMGSIRKLSEFLAGVRGRRKAMVLFGEGIDYDVNQAMGVDGSTASIVLEDIRNAIAAAQHGNVAIYTVDPRGLFEPADGLIESAFTLHDDTPGAALQAANRRGLGREPAAAQVDQSTLLAEVNVAQNGLRALAYDTGGFSVLNTSEFEHAFDRIIQENSSYYLLGYYPANDKRDGRLRRLQVRVKRAGLTVRARNGYVAPRGKSPSASSTGTDAASRAVLDALGSPLPVAGVPMTVFAAAFKGTTPNATIAYSLEIDASRFVFVERNGTWSDRVDVLHTVASPDGRVTPGERQHLDLMLNAESYTRVKAGGLRVVGELELPAGRYQLRFAAGDDSGSAGNVLFDLEVPDFAREALTMSSVALTSRESANAMGTIRARNPLGDVLPGPPVATRQFHQGDMLTLFAEIYEHAPSNQLHQVIIRSQLRDITGRVLTQHTETRPSSDLQGRSGGYGFSSDLSLAAIAPGLYFLQVEAQAQTEGLPAVTRGVQFRVIR